MHRSYRATCSALALCHALLLLPGCAAQPRARSSVPPKVEEPAADSSGGRWAPPTSTPRPIALPPELAEHQEDVRKTVQKACEVVRVFAGAHGWADRVDDCFYDGVEVFASSEELVARIFELHQLPKDTALPEGAIVVAALEKRVLMAVTPTTFQTLQPDYASSENAWMRLFAHEIGHRLHVAILEGNEDAMGPTWFFEGFAVVAAGQQLGSPLTFSTRAEALEGTRAKGPGAYRQYGAAVRYFSSKIPLPELVQRAGAPDFEAWLIERLGESS